MTGEEYYKAQFAEQESTLSGIGPAWTKNLRRDGLAAFEAAGFPGMRDEAWRFTRVKAIRDLSLRGKVTLTLAAVFTGSAATLLLALGPILGEQRQRLVEQDRRLLSTLRRNYERDFIYDLLSENRESLVVHLGDLALQEGVVWTRIETDGLDLGATASNVDPGGGLSQIADGPWAVRKAVREQRKERVDIVKIFIDGEAINPVTPPGELSFCDEEVEAAVDEAHRHKLRVACHARSAAAVKQAVRAGVDFVGHANYLDDEAVELLQVTGS